MYTVQGEIMTFTCLKLIQMATSYGIKHMAEPVMTLLRWVLVTGIRWMEAKAMILWLEEDYGLSRREAYLLISICPEFRLRTYQMCSGLGRLMITVGAEFPKHLLPS